MPALPRYKGQRNYRKKDRQAEKERRSEREKKKLYRLMLLINTDTKILKKILANPIQHHIKILGNQDLLTKNKNDSTQKIKSM